ncbi:hypothetical protein EDB84DRAFT_793372 [Lactarius hengduanensis]|nr:hypothetical protein EDB84DRAFT_793372 [Lactarius hengduanensis]
MSRLSALSRHSLSREILLPPSGQGFSFYSAEAVLPLLTPKQRVTSRTDWLTTDAEISHPDPNFASELRIPTIHIGLRRFRHGETTQYQCLLPKEPLDYDVAWV